MIELQQPWFELCVEQHVHAQHLEAPVAELVARMAQPVVVLLLLFMMMMIIIMVLVLVLVLVLVFSISISVVQVAAE